MQKLAKDTILIGHALHNDLRVLKIIHHIVIDTSHVFRRTTGQAQSLKYIAQQELNFHMQPNSQGHNPIIDARTCIRLMRKKISTDDLEDNVLHCEGTSTVTNSNRFAHQTPRATDRSDVSHDYSYCTPNRQQENSRGHHEEPDRTQEEEGVGWMGAIGLGVGILAAGAMLYMNSGTKRNNRNQRP